MTYCLQNRYQDSGWEWMAEQFAYEYEAIAFAKHCACLPVHYGMVRVISPKGEVVVTYGAGEGIDKGWKKALQEVCPAWKPAKDHISPNGAQPGSFIHHAEKWALNQGLKIPTFHKHPRMFHGMLDDYSEVSR